MPARLVAILSLTAVVLLFGIDALNVGNLGTISQMLPTFLIPDVPFNFETLKIIFQTALALSIIELLESPLTGFFGGMVGASMIGLEAEIVLMFLIVVLGEWVVLISMPVLAAIMVMVYSIGFHSNT
ncbi:hypothetical protein [Sporosarcina sp. FSL K6-1508]|uniref:hypothetical protein n=1 Tax=Sporosarcina sp. FSL K6-1508 TaxID=2921553 RepID=UPI0030F7AAB8